MHYSNGQLSPYSTKHPQCFERQLCSYRPQSDRASPDYSTVVRNTVDVWSSKTRAVRSSSASAMVTRTPVRPCGDWIQSDDDTVRITAGWVKYSGAFPLKKNIAGANLLSRDWLFKVVRSSVQSATWPNWTFKGATGWGIILLIIIYVITYR